MLGFGFNKAKILASAERHVRQGKLQNAILDYEKIAKEDPKDLYVLNTIGDLYARLGNAETAAEYFQQVGDAYASDGFTVRAIAMYKKLTKQKPDAFEVIQRLAQLYVQQGLHNDAKVQFAQVAENFLQHGDNASATRVFQKILELDPENVPAQTKLADLYLRTGKRSEARDVLLRSAHALHARGAADASDAALGKVLELDPSCSQALLLRGQSRLDKGDGEGAIQCLEAIPDLDSRADGLRVLLHAYLKLGRKAEAEPVAGKLLNVFHDTSAVIHYADWLVGGGDWEGAIRVYQENAAQLLPSDTPAVVERLLRLIAAVRDNPAALEALSELFQQAGSTSHLAEVTELLAHAWVNKGEHPKARDLYRRLAEMEPENPMHMQNYLQVLAQLGEEHAPLALNAPEEGPALLAAELDESPTPIDQTYSPEVAAALQQALTDAELYASYNLPARAIPPLETALVRTPQDVQLNQRLASLYARDGRLMEAAQRCQVLQSVYAEAGRTAESQKYAELARQFGPAGSMGAPALAQTPPIASVVSTPAPALTEPTVRVEPEPLSPAPGWFESGAAIVQAPSAAKSMAHEIDLSEEWERILAQDRSSVARPAASATDQSLEPSASSPEAAATSRGLAPSPVDDILEEVRFYLTQSMIAEANMALARAEEVAPNAPAVLQLRAKLAALTATIPEAPADSMTPPAGGFGGFAHDLDKSLGHDFNLAPAQERTVAATLGDEIAIPHVATNSLPAQTRAPGFAAIDVPADLGSGAALRPSLPNASGASLITDFGDEGAGLAALFAEFKQDMESGAPDVDDDPETHYNLGIAFKEMGLMDEAIGELQKVCQSIEHGHEFPRTVEAYTWLAHCFLETGVPEAGIKWYEKALQIRGLGSDSTIALHYELACAHEAAGHLVDARRHFMQVLSNNIDYRDVAERIKALKS